MVVPRLHPTHGPSSGGTVVVFLGMGGYWATLECVFDDGIMVPALTSASDPDVRCTTPQRAEEGDVRVVRNTYGETSQEMNFMFSPEATIGTIGVGF